MPSRPSRHEPPRLPRPTATQRGYDAHWRRLRAVIIRRDLGLCQQCRREGKLNAVGMSGHVDHIIPHRGQSDERFWDERNLETLCATHHSLKTNEKDGGFGRMPG